MPAIKAKNFFNSALKEFSQEDNVRSIPDLFDGLKVSQRKALYGSQLRGESAGELQVERLAAKLSESTDYHHGTGSMESTVVGMANNYPGSNNMNLFEPIGQFGSRLTKSAASPRYIFTKFSKNFRLLFKKEDDGILQHHFVDGEKIEPIRYIPLLPAILVNGAQGTGTGHASVIMCYNPNDLKDAVLKILAGKKLKPRHLTPWYNGYHGTITRNPETGQVVCEGLLEVVNTTTIHITELPIGTFDDDFKEHLSKLFDTGFVKEFDDHSTEDQFNFIITVPRSTTQHTHEELMQKFKLISRETENFTCWQENGTLKRFETAEEIVEVFTNWRIARYEDRRLSLIKNTEESIRWASEKYRFIQFYLGHVDYFKDKKKQDLIDLLVKNEFDDYDRLLSMNMWNLTREKIEELKKQLDELKKYLKIVKADTAIDMYTRELKEFKY